MSLSLSSYTRSVSVTMGPSGGLVRIFGTFIRVSGLSYYVTSESSIHLFWASFPPSVPYFIHSKLTYTNNSFVWGLGLTSYGRVYFVPKGGWVVL